VAERKGILSTNKKLTSQLKLKMKCCCPRKSRSNLKKYSPKAPTGRAPSPPQICSPRLKSRRHRATQPLHRGREWPCGHPQGLGVAFGPSQALRGHPRPLGGGRTATPGPWGGRAAPPGVCGWPERGGGLRANPSVRASLTVGFGLAVTASSDPDSGGFRHGRCGPARALVAFSDLGVAESVQIHVGGVGVGVAVAVCSDPVGGSVVQYGSWRRGLAWAVPAASGLTVVVRIWARAFSAWSRSGVSTTL